jgi:hypothetical protein
MWGELDAHDALNDMAAAVLDASLVALLGVVTVTDAQQGRPGRSAPGRARDRAAALRAGRPGSLGSGSRGLGAGGFLLAAALLRPDGMGPAT